MKAENSETVPGPIFSSNRLKFAKLIFTDRILNIFTKIINELYKRALKLSSTLDEEFYVDVMEIMDQVVSLRSQIMKSQRFTLISDEKADNVVWNHEITTVETSESCVTKRWMDCPILFSECYYYRKLFEIFVKSKYHQDYDYFMFLKERATSHAQPFIKILANIFLSIPRDYTPSKEHLRIFILFSTFSNKIDLSMSAGDHKVNINHLDFDIYAYEKDLLSNDLEDVCDYIVNSTILTNKTYHFVLDNCGLELFSDICLGIYLLKTKLASKVIFHVKKFPTFVSDVTLLDISYLSSFLFETLDEDLINIANTLADCIENGLVEITTDFSWTFSHQYSDLLDVWPQFIKIYEDFKKSQLVIFKGDLNFRRLCGERHWNMITPMNVALRNFNHFPLLVLRTIKSVSVCGLKLNSVSQVQALRDDWYIKGEKGQIIFVNE